MPQTKANKIPLPIHWSDPAFHDFQDLVDYIALDSPVDAVAVLDQIEDRVQRLAEFPNQGRVVPELARQQITRYEELILAPYRIIYRVEFTEINILAVIDGRRNLADLLLNRILNPKT